MTNTINTNTKPGLLYAIVRTRADGVVVRTYQRAARCADVYAAEPPAGAGEKLRVYPATVDPATGACIVEGINALALDIARRVTRKAASRQCLDMQYRIHAALCAIRDLWDPRTDDPDAADVFAEPRKGICAAIAAGLPIEQQARAGYSRCNAYMYTMRGGKQTEHDMRTEYVEEGDEIVDVGAGIALLLRQGARPTYIPRDADDAPVHAVTQAEADTIRDIVPRLSQQQRAVMLHAARGLSQRQTADAMHIRAGTVAYHAGEVHRIARKLYPAIADSLHARAVHWSRLCAAARARREEDRARRAAAYSCEQTEQK